MLVALAQCNTAQPPTPSAAGSISGGLLKVEFSNTGLSGQSVQKQYAQCMSSRLPKIPKTQRVTDAVMLPAKQSTHRAPKFVQTLAASVLTQQGAVLPAFGPFQCANQHLPAPLAQGTHLAAAASHATPVPCMQL